jgi:hypothetical protein
MHKPRVMTGQTQWALIGLLIVMSCAASQANSFTSGNIVVYRVGDGTATLTDNGNAVFLDEYTPSGSLVQSVALPTTASGSQKPLIASSDVSEGLLARSTQGQYVLLTGYASNLGGSTALATTAATAVPRTVGRVKFDGTIDTSTALTDVSNANNPRSATSTDGVDIWVGGASGSSGGVHYTTLGSTTSTQLFSTIPKGVRQANIFGGQLYFDSNAAGLLNVSAVGVGTPTTGGQTGTELPGLADIAGNDGYFFADLGGGHGLATLYVANDGLGEILKYSLVSGSWTTSGTITAAGVHGVTGVVSGSSVTLHATGTTGTDGTLYSFTDTTGYDGIVSGMATILATAAANEAFRGVALAPVSPAGPTQTPTATPRPSVTPSVTRTPTRTGTATHTPFGAPTATKTATPTTTGTLTGTPTNTFTPTDTPTPTPLPCTGDCDGSGDVTVNELIVMVNIALGAPLSDCTVGDANHDGQITIDELIAAVNDALNGCPVNLGTVTWTLQGNAPLAVTIDGGPWTLTQLAPGNPSPPNVPNKSYGYDASFMTANSGKTSVMQPYYFPLTQGHGNDLQGYFDWRPKDINEAIVAANSTDGGETWQFQQMALVLTQALPVNQQSTNPDANQVDDGFGHPSIIQLGNTTFLYTLDRSTASVDNLGLVVSTLAPTEDMPLSGALPNVPLIDIDKTDETKVVRTTGLLNPDGIVSVVPGSSPAKVMYVQKILGGDATGATALPVSQQCGTQPYAPSGASSPNAANHDLINVRLATTTDGINFTDLGAVSGLYDSTATSYVGTRWIAPHGTLLNLGTGRYGLFFAGGNCMDADSDSFHYIGYAESTDPELKTWNVINGINNPIASIGAHTVPVDGVQTTIPAQTPVVGPALDAFEGRVYSPSATIYDEHTIALTFAGYKVQSPKNDLLDYRTISVVQLKASRALPSQN